MNEKFFSLPEKRQKIIMDAGYRVFSQNSYKKSPMSEIAAEAGISKSLLFHYFHNKRELYLFLWETCGDITIRYLTEYGCYEQTDFFEMMLQGMRAKLQILKEYPNMWKFAVKAFYEKDPAVRPAIWESYRKLLNHKALDVLESLDTGQFLPGLDLNMMYREMYLATEGYMWEMLRTDEVSDGEKIEQDFIDMIAFWKKIYLKKEEKDESN